MIMKGVARGMLLASAALMIPSTMHPQTPASGGRRTELEYLDKGFDLPGITDVGQPGIWNTPEARARYEQHRLQEFEEDVEGLSELGKQDWVTQYDSVSDRQVRREFERRAKDLENVTDDLIEFFEWRFAAEPIEAAEPAERDIRERVAQISPVVGQILEAISTLQGGGIQIEEFIGMREKLARIHALSRALRD